MTSSEQKLVSKSKQIFNILITLFLTNEKSPLPKFTTEYYNRLLCLTLHITVFLEILSDRKWSHYAI